MNKGILGKIERAKGIIKEALWQYKKIAVFSSFGKDSVVTLHLVRQIRKDIPTVFLNTHYKFKETIAYKDYITALWNLDLREYSAPLLGMNLWQKDIDKCCNYYKVEPTKRAIKEMELDAWISGLRNTEGGQMRQFTQEVEIKGNDLVKINPILSFTEKDIWMYHAMFNIPIHPLYTKGYRSLGCEHCSAIGKDDEPERAKRWDGKKLECGIHLAEHLKS